MKKTIKNKKGFTLIELLAVIVILGILLAVAVPAAVKYINGSKKSAFVDNAKEYANAAVNQVSFGTYDAPVNNGDATIICFNELVGDMQRGGKVSSYGAEYDLNNSFVVIANTGTAEDPEYDYFVTMIDTANYGIGASNTDGKMATTVIEYDSLSSKDVVRISSDSKLTTPSVNGSIVTSGGTFTVTKVYSTPATGE